MKFLADIISGVTKKIEEFSVSVETVGESIRNRNDVLKANMDFDLKLHQERTVIDGCISVAESQLETEKTLMAEGDEFKKYYFETLKRLDASDDRANAEEADLKVIIHVVPERERHPNPEVEKAITDERQFLQSAQSRYFEEVRRRLSKDDRLRELVRLNLVERGCEQFWRYIS